MLLLWWPKRSASALPWKRPRRRYAVKIGDEWVTVDAGNPAAVQRAIRAAQAAAERTAQVLARKAAQRPKKRVARPEHVASHAVAVRALERASGAVSVRDDGRRLAEELRAAYVAALVSELADRIEIERDEQDVEVLLLA